MVVLGYLNPDHFLGGRIRLNVEAAAQGLKSQVTEVVGVDLYRGAEGIVGMLENRARDAPTRAAGAARSPAPGGL